MISRASRRTTLLPLRAIFFIFLFGFSGCLGDLRYQAGGALPEWLETPPADTKVLYYGVGEGVSLMRAKEAALNDIAGILGINVSSKVGSHVRQYGEHVKDLAYQVITAQIHETKLIHPRVLKTAKHDGKIYVLLSVSREAMTRDARSRLKHIDQHLKQQWQALPSLSRLQQFIRTQKLSSQIDRAVVLAFTLPTLDRRFVNDPYLDRYNRYRQKSDDLLSKTHFRIRPIKIMKPVAQNLVALLSRSEIQSSLASFGRGFLSRDPLIEVKGDVKIDKAFSSKIARLTVVFEVKDGRGNIIASRKHQVTGNSLNDAASATRDAVEKLMKQWKRQPVLNVIGLNI